MKKKIAAAVVLAALSAPAIASDEGVYLDLNLGSAKYTNAEPFGDPGKFGIGMGYKFNKYFAADVGLTIFGDSTFELIGVGKATLKMNSFHPAIVGIYPFTEKFSAFGKFGFSRNRLEYSDTLGFTFESTKTSPYYGAGLEYDINPKLGFRALYENFGKFDAGGGDTIGASAFSLGLIVYFQ
jgi:opacity protein-like surface antigen